MSSKFKSHLYNMLESLDTLQSRDVVLNEEVQGRLDTSLEQYKNAMKNMYDYVMSRDNLKVLKAIAKLNSKGENQHDN